MRYPSLTFATGGEVISIEESIGEAANRRKNSTASVSVSSSSYSTLNRCNSTGTNAHPGPVPVTCSVYGPLGPGVGTPGE